MTTGRFVQTAPAHPFNAGDAPTLHGKSADSLVDSWVFAGNGPALRDVMVGGRWVVRQGRHAAEGRIGAAFRRTLDRILPLLDVPA